MFGNFVENPKKSGNIDLIDIEFFIYRLLLDMSEASNNTILKNQTKVDYHRSSNLGDLNATNNTKLLMTFSLDFEDNRNRNLFATQKAPIDNAKVVYRVNLTMQKSPKNNEDLMLLTQLINNNLGNNTNKTVNDTNREVVPYITLVPSGNRYSTVLDMNESDSFPEILIVGESLDEPNYLTTSSKILFTINKLN